jgi:hypothetical protein
MVSPISDRSSTGRRPKRSEDQVAADNRRLRDAAARQLLDQFREHRHDDAEPDHVEQDGEQDAGERQSGVFFGCHAVRRS